MDDGKPSSRVVKRAGATPVAEPATTRPAQRPTRPATGAASSGTSRRTARPNEKLKATQQPPMTGANREPSG